MRLPTRTTRSGAVPVPRPVGLPARRSSSTERGYMGRVESGEIRVGDAVQVLPSGRTTRVKEIRLHDESLARGEQAVRDAPARGRARHLPRDLLVRAGDTTPARKVDVLCWLSERPLAAGPHLVRHRARAGHDREVGYRVDLGELERPAATLAMNDIARVSLRLAQPIAADRYADSRATGALIVIDEATNDTVAAGMIL